MNPFHSTRYELFNLDGTYYGAVHTREGDRQGWVTLTSVPGEPPVDGKGRVLVEWRGLVFRAVA
jgi:hypothetical protein